MAAALIVELFGGAHQAEVSLLNQVDQGDAGACIAARDGNDQPQIRFDKFATRTLITRGGTACQCYLFLMRKQAETTDVMQITLKGILSTRRVLGIRYSSRSSTLNIFLSIALVF